MTAYTVEWTPSAESELARIWLRAPDQGAVTSAQAQADCLLEQNPQVRDQLKKHRQMLPTMERYARELKTRHETWKEQLSQAMPDSDPSQIASEALAALSECLGARRE